MLASLVYCDLFIDETVPSVSYKVSWYQVETYFYILVLFASCDGHFVKASIRLCSYKDTLA